MTKSLEKEIRELEDDAKNYLVFLPKLKLKLETAPTIDPALTKDIEDLTKDAREAAALLKELLKKTRKGKLDALLARRLTQLGDDFEKIDTLRTELITALKGHDDFSKDVEEESGGDDISISSSVENEPILAQKKKTSYEPLFRKKSPSSKPLRFWVASHILLIPFIWLLFYPFLKNDQTNRADEQTRADSDEARGRAENKADEDALLWTYVTWGFLEVIDMTLACWWTIRRRQHNHRRDFKNLEGKFILNEQNNEQDSDDETKLKL